VLGQRDSLMQLLRAAALPLFQYYHIAILTSSHYQIGILTFTHLHISTLAFRHCHSHIYTFSHFLVLRDKRYLHLHRFIISDHCAFHSVPRLLLFKRGHEVVNVFDLGGAELGYNVIGL